MQRQNFCRIADLRIAVCIAAFRFECTDLKLIGLDLILQTLDLQLGLFDIELNLLNIVGQQLIALLDSIALMDEHLFDLLCGIILDIHSLLGDDDTCKIRCEQICTVYGVDCCNLLHIDLFRTVCLCAAVMLIEHPAACAESADDCRRNNSFDDSLGRHSIPSVIVFIAMYHKNCAVRPSAGLRQVYYNTAALRLSMRLCQF